MTKVTVSAGPNQFGGVMQLLGALGTVQAGSSTYITSSGGTSFVIFSGVFPTWGARLAGGSYAVMTVVYGTYTGMVNFHAPMSTLSSFTITSATGATVTGFPWTTGTVSVSAAGDIGMFPEFLVRRGYDNRSPMGSLGIVQLVSPHLTHWAVTHTAEIAILRLEFVPEPTSWLLLVTGAGLLAVLYRRRQR